MTAYKLIAENRLREINELQNERDEYNYQLDELKKHLDVLKENLELIIVQSKLNHECNKRNLYVYYFILFITHIYVFLKYTKN